MTDTNETNNADVKDPGGPSRPDVNVLPPMLTQTAKDEFKVVHRLGAFDIVLSHIIFVETVKELTEGEYDGQFVIRVVFNGHDINVYFKERKDADRARTALMQALTLYHKKVLE